MRESFHPDKLQTTQAHQQALSKLQQLGSLEAATRRHTPPSPTLPHSPSPLLPYSLTSPLCPHTIPPSPSPCPPLPLSPPPPPLVPPSPCPLRRLHLPHPPHPPPPPAPPLLTPSPIRRCEEDALRSAGRLRSAELLLACTAGRHGGAIATLEERARGHAAEQRQWEDRVARLEGRLTASENRSLSSGVLRAVAASAGGAFWLAAAAARLAGGVEEGRRAATVWGAWGLVEVAFATGAVRRVKSFKL